MQNPEQLLNELRGGLGDSNQMSILVSRSEKKATSEQNWPTSVSCSRKGFIFLKKELPAPFSPWVTNLSSN